MCKRLFLIAVVITLFSCKQSTIDPPSSYIYVAHTRINSNDGLYDKVYGIDFSSYDMTLLGGDLSMSSFSRKKVILPHLDSVFDFKSPNTLWSVGNHDNVSNKRFYETTLKNKFHLYQRDDVTFITLNSQDSLSSIVGNQKNFLFSVLDTIQTRSVLIMTHKLIFMNDHPVLDKKISKVCNANKGDCFHCHNPNNFYTTVYPKLLEVKKRGIQVLWVGGDLGYKTSEFEYVDDQGIVFLGNGFWFKKDWNKVLLFSKAKDTDLSYEFIPIDSLLKNQEASLKSLKDK
ncbi:hypothetical protein [uncultured Dokdonia sp.]|uniref:hypothetical protein n=1 Tax=uncultured Dokdonia sp. TaxID=575653 RepID=UPI00263746AC|nr:hypothetical protein [uncultured Dokdonia sp.]